MQPVEDRFGPGSRRFSALLLCLFVMAASLPAPVARATEPEKTVRVGWYDSSYNTVDQYGRRSGYAYEYQLKIAAYTGWTYEYVNGSWSDLLQMLHFIFFHLVSPFA